MEAQSRSCPECNTFKTTNFHDHLLNEKSIDLVDTHTKRKATLLSSLLNEKSIDLVDTQT
jgi:hypothetical protein